MTHISLELAKWLKERGCEVENGMCILLDCNELCRKEDLGDYRIGRDAMRTYSWYDILVTHSREFWGEEMICEYCMKYEPVDWGEEVVGRKYCNEDVGDFAYQPQYLCRAKELVAFLQQNGIQQAEDYVRKYSVFANPKP